MNLYDIVVQLVHGFTTGFCIKQMDIITMYSVPASNRVGHVLPGLDDTSVNNAGAASLSHLHGPSGPTMVTYK